MASFFITVVVATFTLKAAALAPMVHTQYGNVRGAEKILAHAYLGIPYAAPPVGPLRWRAPHPPRAWTTALDGSQYGASCLQPNLLLHGRSMGNEDCLTLNVWRPKTDQKNLPVLFFIHGGGNAIGGSNQDILGSNLYDGANLAAKQSVVVTINYRLGALGFLAHPALKDASGLEGNYAIMDQIQALRFVQQNIEAFGGDPTNVTIFGESAGAINVLALIATPLAKGLFKGAIVESGFLTEQPLVTAEEAGAKFASAAGCVGPAVAKCLRALPTANVLRTMSALSQTLLSAESLTIDGYVLPQTILETFQRGVHNQVPVILGTNRDEMRTLLSAVANVGLIVPIDQYHSVLTQQFGSEKAAAIAGKYPWFNYASPRLALEEIINDFAAHCPARRLVRALIRYQPQTYRYVFTHVSDSPALALLGAGHGLELPFVFGNMGLERSLWEFQLSDLMQEQWLRFAHTENPTLPKTAWNSAKNDDYLDIDFLPEMKTAFHDERCDFWDELTSP